MLLLVDALDEAQTYTGVTLPDLLSRLDDLPPGVRILATTGDEPEVLKFFRAEKPFDLKSKAPIGMSTTCGRTPRGGLQDLRCGRGSVRTLRDGSPYRPTACSCMRRWCWTEVFERLPAELPNLDDYLLPKGLHGLYQEFITRQLGKVRQRWVDDYKPLLGLIAVAQGEGLAASQWRVLLSATRTRW